MLLLFYFSCYSNTSFLWPFLAYLYHHFLLCRSWLCAGFQNILVIFPLNGLNWEVLGGFLFLKTILLLFLDNFSLQGVTMVYCIHHFSISLQLFSLAIFKEQVLLLLFPIPLPEHTFISGGFSLFPVNTTSGILFWKAYLYFFQHTKNTWFTFEDLVQLLQRA